MPLPHKKHTFLQLLGEMNYNPMPSVKSLMTPSNKDYFRIVEFLFSSIAKNYKMVGRQDEELLKLLKDLKLVYYNGNIL